MKAKKIMDIRLFEEMEPSKSLPDYAGKGYEVEKNIHWIGTRFARECLKTQQGADIAEFSFHARRFFEGLPGVSQEKVT